MVIKLVNSENNLPVTRFSVSITYPDGSVVVDTWTLDKTDGIVQRQSCLSGTFAVHVESDGFIAADDTIEVGCEQADFTVERLVSISPVPELAQTSIILTRDRDSGSVRYVDIHVVSVRISDNDKATCRTSRTYNDNEDECDGISLVYRGGTQNVIIDKISRDYGYLIGIVDDCYGQADFLQSGSKITITNGEYREVAQMAGSSRTNE